MNRISYLEPDGLRLQLVPC